MQNTSLTLCSPALKLYVSSCMEIFSTFGNTSSSCVRLIKSQSQRQLGQSYKLYCNADLMSSPAALFICPYCRGSVQLHKQYILKWTAAAWWGPGHSRDRANWWIKLRFKEGKWELVLYLCAVGMKFQGYSGQTPIISPQLLRGDHWALYKSTDCRTIYVERKLNRKLKASLWPFTPNYRDQITQTSILSLPTKAVTRVSHASWCALEWDSAPLSTCRSEDYIQGFRRGKEAVIWNCCVLLLCTFLNAMLSCSMRWYCMTVAWGSSAGETIFVSPDECCPMFCSSLISFEFF